MFASPKDHYPLPLTFQHRAGVSPYTSSCDFARTCVFSKQSLLTGLCHPITLGPQRAYTLAGSPFSRSYGGILPSSLTIVRSYASVFSTWPPVLVWGTGRVCT